MNEQDFSAGLRAVHRDRTSLPDVDAVHEQLLGLPFQDIPYRRGFLPPFTWRFQSMFSATKFVVAGAIVALFGGFLLAGVLTQQEGSVPGAATDGAAPKAAVVSGQFESVFYDTASGTGHGMPPDELLYFYRGQTFDGQAEMSDVRLNGEVAGTIHADIWEPHEGCHNDQDVPSTCVRLDWGTLDIQNDEGGWVGTWVRQFAEPQVSFIELVGTGGYEGWSAILSTTGDLLDTTWSVSGTVFNGNLPPDREAYLEE